MKEKKTLVKIFLIIVKNYKSNDCTQRPKWRLIAAVTRNRGFLL